MDKRFATAYDQNPARRAIIMKRKRSRNMLAVQALAGFQAVLGTMAAYLGIS